MKKIEHNKLKLSNISLLVFVCLFIFLNFFQVPVNAQSGIQTDTTARKQDSTVKYLTPWEYAFMMNEETSWMFKIDFPATFDFNQIKLGIEKRIAPGFSLNLDIEFYSNSKNQYEKFSSERFSGLNASLESRWYYRMNKRVKQLNVARNMSDNYLALGFEYGYQFNTYPYIFSTLDLYAKWGVQRRFLKYGHVDFGVKASIDLLYGRHVFTFNNFIDVGFAFTKDKYKIDRNILCPVLKCYVGDKFIIKSNLSNTFGTLLSKVAISIGFHPHIAFERKISHSSFSVNFALRPGINYHLINFNGSKSDYWSYSVNTLLEGRWYYNLKRRMLKGKSGNGLSANYLAIGGELHYENKYYYSFDSFYPDYVAPKLYIVTGWQRLFGKHLYYDLNIGIGYKFKTKNEDAGIAWPFNIAVGYRF